MKVAIVGTGYVGLTTGAALAQKGHHVVCVDIDEKKIQALKRGFIPFYEPHLENLVQKGIKQNHLHFTKSYVEALQECLLCFFCLPTPSQEDNACDISYLLNAASHVAEIMTAPLVIVNKSTAPVGTSEKIADSLRRGLNKRGINFPFYIASNPEFLREGTAVTDALYPERILIGVDSPQAEALLKQLYLPFSEEGVPVLITDILSAEFAKYAANAMLGARISLMNELSQVCEQVGADIGEVQKALGYDKRIGPHYLSPGIGFGGSCLPKDIKALQAMALENAESTPILDSILEVNQRQKERFFHKILKYFGSLSHKTLALWGLSFKPETDDLREAPSLYLIEKFLEEKALLRLYDPVALPKVKELLKPNSSLTFCENPYEASRGADAIILITEWKEFQDLDLIQVLDSLTSKVFFDGRGQYDPKQMQKLGFAYFSIGKPPYEELELSVYA